LLFPEPQQFRVTEQSLQGRQPPKQLNSFDQLGNFILDQLVFRGFRETIEIDRVLPLKQTKRSFLRGFADADSGRMRRFQQIHSTMGGTRSLCAGDVGGEGRCGPGVADLRLVVEKPGDVGGEGSCGPRVADLRLVVEKPGDVGGEGSCGPRAADLRLVVQKPVGGGAADLPVATAVISEAVHSGSAAVSEDAPRRVMPSAAVSGTLGRGILVVASSSVSGTLGRGISAVVISFSSTSRDYNFLSINSRDASRFTLLRQMGDASLEGSSQIMRWETSFWMDRLRS
jgi:hypothetical protein